MAKKKESKGNKDEKPNKKQEEQQKDLKFADVDLYGINGIDAANLGALRGTITQPNVLGINAANLGALGISALGNNVAHLRSMVTPAASLSGLNMRYDATGFDLNLASQTIKIEQDLEEEISQLKRENRTLLEELADKRRDESEQAQEIKELKDTFQHLSNNLREKERLQHLFYRVHPTAWEKLKQDEEFRKLFEQKTPCTSVIMSIDIRRSTELMLRAKDPDSYQNFIVILCAQLRNIILENYGVFDKFTGDGILSFFPNFYSGDDAIYLALKSAKECHNCFDSHYKKNRSCFATVFSDVGLGIGIDYGDAHLVNVHDWLTVIGRPVVHACRLSAAPAGHTLLNQQAHDIASDKFGGYVNFQEFELSSKHEGSIITYSATLTDRTPETKKPAWLETSH